MGPQDPPVGVGPDLVHHRRGYLDRNFFEAVTDLGLVHVLCCCYLSQNFFPLLLLSLYFVHVP